MNSYTQTRNNTLINAIILTFCIIMLPAATAYSGDAKSVLPEYVYTPSKAPKLQVEAALERAKAEDKYALIVLGAQWCHDSVGLSERFSTDEMQSILEERYVTQFIDVGYLEDRREITNLVGYPTYFATPTVMIVDPTTNTLVNIGTMTIWQSADSVEMDTYIAEFSKWNKKESNQTTTTTPKTEFLAQFEKQQSERLQQGYKALGPMLAASEVKNGQSDQEKETFYQLWNETKVFRKNVQASIHRFRGANIEPSLLEKELLEATPELQSWEISKE
ncbi:thioredoxin family protein [Glaciecola sp. MF2-115]|uniref:thioredoxin family protein n=1 Tax=Glaciecola sp. MF2-115 TaxID=3384827 RepID=UPI0039A05889